MKRLVRWLSRRWRERVARQHEVELRAVTAQERRRLHREMTMMAAHSLAPGAMAIRDRQLADFDQYAEAELATRMERVRQELGLA